MWNIIIGLSGALLVSSVASPYQSTEELSVGDNMSPPLRVLQTDMEAMVDLTNNLGVSILKDHSHSKGNFAFSPYGVASVLVVLYEGAKGQSAVQIQRSFGFPWNKDAIRVGFREIHQHLRSYFSHEGYLSGINLNKRQSSLRPEFKKILKLYGYDVELDDEIPDDLAIRGATGSGNETATAQTTTQSVTETQSVETTTESQTTTESSSEQTTIPPTTTTEENTSNTSVTTTTNPPTTTLKEETTTQSDSTMEIILEEYTVKPAEQTQTSVRIQTTEQPQTTERTTEEITSTPQQLDSIMVDINDRLHISLTIESECRKRGRRSGEDSNCPTGDAEGKTNKPKTDTNNPKITLESINNEIAKLDNKMLIPQADDPLLLPDSAWSETSSRKSRKTRHLASAVGAKSAIEMSGISKREAANIRRILSRRVHLWTSSVPRRTGMRRPRTITDYLKQPENGELSLQLQNGMHDTHIPSNEEASKNLPRKLFLIDGTIDTPVPMMSYTYFFPYAYLPKLHAKALEFPLDDTRYKLLILLPIDRKGLKDLIQDLMGYPLRLVLDSMKPAKVNVTIPTFMVEGFVILTSSLKKLGIRDVFDPRKANLSGMSVDPELYVRNVEQSVTVVIRNYMEVLDISTSTMAARYIDYNFEVSHPFLYFVLDTATNVALMTGQMLDPLNSRIY